MQGRIWKIPLSWEIFELVRDPDQPVQDDLAHTEADGLLGAAGADAREKGRKGSTCKQLRPLPTFVKSQSSLDLAEKTYVRKKELSEEEVECNEKLFEETMAVLFPEEKMRDKFYRDKVRPPSLPQLL